MKIIIINGSPRKNGLTAGILHTIEDRLTQKGAQVSFIELSELDMKPCRGCCSCYKNGGCIFKDDAEKLSDEIDAADGLVIGSPTYASNVSGILKTFIDRGHFVIEQLLIGKYAVSVATGENYGSGDTGRVINKLLSYSGADISAKIVQNAAFNSGRFDREKAERAADRIYDDISKGSKHIFQRIIQKMIFTAGIRPFVIKNKENYSGVISRWQSIGLIDQKL